MAAAPHVRRLHRVLLLIVILLGVAPFTTTEAQPVLDTIAGRVADQNDQPLAGATVVITQRATGDSHQLRTSARGTFAVPITNTKRGYLVVVTAVGFAPARLTVQRDSTMSARQTLVANLRLVPIVQQLDAVKVQASRRPRFEGPDSDRLNVGSNGREAALDALNGEINGDLATLLGTIAGISVTGDGYSVLGLGADQNVTTIGGLNVDVSTLPRDALANASVSTTSFNPANGGFSGGQLNLSLFSSTSGSRNLRFTIRPSALSSAGNSRFAATRQQDEFQLGGQATGGYLRERGSYGTSFQISRRTLGSQGLEAGNTLALFDLGLDRDSVSRLLSHASSLRITDGATTRTQYRDAGSLTFVTTMRFSPDRTASLQVIGSGARSQNDGLSPFAVGSAGLESRSHSLALLGTYVHFVRSVVRASLRVGVQTGGASSSAIQSGPAARVTMGAVNDGDVSFATVTLGGNPNVTQPSRNQSADILGRVGWMSLDAKHEVEIAANAHVERARSDPSRNRLGTFTYQSLDDFLSERPATFVRTLQGTPREGAVGTSWISVADSWLPHPTLTIGLGGRYDVGQVTSELAQNPDVQRLFGISTASTPSLNRFSPRLGFSWDVQQATAGGQSAGFSRVRRRGTISGSYGLYVNSLRASSLNAVLGSSGINTSDVEVRCEGANAPIAEWSVFLLEPSRIPTSCAGLTGGGQPVAAQPRVAAFASSVEPSRSWRGSLSWRGTFTERLSVSTELTHSHTFGGQSRLDRNLLETPRYFAANDGGRAVFVAPSDIVASSGIVPLLASRQTSSYGIVNEIRSDLESMATQWRISLRQGFGRTISEGLTLSYVRLRARQQTRAPSDIANDGRPNDIRWSRSSSPSHFVTIGFSRRIVSGITPTLLYQYSAGGRFTPLIAGDANGDGQYNDRPFVTPALAALGDGCLARQVGRIAALQSCVAPSNSSLHAAISIAGGNLGLPRRMSARVLINNLPAAADLMLNGGSAKGWGAQRFVDPTALVVRGYDANARQFVYVSNPRFGRTQRLNSEFSQGARITIEGMVDFSPDPRRELVRLFQRGGYDQPVWNRESANSIFSSLRTGGASVFRLFAVAHDSVGLTARQKLSLDSLNKELDRIEEAILRPVSELVANAPRATSELGAQVDDAQQRARLEMQRIVREAQLLLTDEQRRRLGPSYRQRLTSLLRTTTSR